MTIAQLQLEVEITPGKANRAKLNRSPLRRTREILGVLRTVVFSPEDLAVVKGDPAERRRFLDELVIARWPRLAGVRADYDRVLRQRNTLLKSLVGRSRGGRGRRGGIHPRRLGQPPGGGRRRAAGGPAGARSADCAPRQPRRTPTSPRPTTKRGRLQDSLDLEAGTARAELVEALLASMTERRADEFQRGLSLVGPHRDDVVLSLGTLPARGYASHGESWSFALALRLGAFQLLRADGVEPVLVLDDVFAELDATRRDRLAAGVPVPSRCWSPPRSAPTCRICSRADVSRSRPDR